MPSLIQSTILLCCQKSYFVTIFDTINKTKLLPRAYLIHAAYFCCKSYYLKKYLFNLIIFFHILNKVKFRIFQLNSY